MITFALIFNIKGKGMTLQLKKYYLFATIICATLLASCTSKKQEAQKEQGIRVKVINLKSDKLSASKNYVGVVEEEKASALSFSVPGNVESILVVEGQLVAKGQLLARLGAENLKSTYDVAQASLKQAQDAMSRLQQLYDNKSLPEIRYVETQTKLDQARSMAAISKKNLSNCRLTAPFSGVIGKRMLDIGENAIPGNTVFTLLDITSVKVKVAMPESEISQMTIGKEASINIPAVGEQVFKGQIAEKGIVAHSVSHTYDVKIRIPNGERKLMPGMVCRIWFNGSPRSAAFVLPNNVVQVSPDGKKYVWCVVNKKAKATWVTTGGLSEQGIIVESGLTEGDVIISEGFQKVSEGMEVAVI